MPIGMIFKVVGSLALLGLVVAAVIAMAVIAVPVVAVGFGGWYWYKRMR